MSQFIRTQRTKPPPVEKVDLTGKTVLVVGANAGLGFEATKHFATMHPGRLILACRSESRGQAALESNLKTGCKNLEVWTIDLSDFGSVRRFADKWEQEGGRLDILVANAAVILPKYEATKDGWETWYALTPCSVATTEPLVQSAGQLSSMPLLTLLLLPHMVRTAQQYSTTPRIVMVASDVHYWANIGGKRVLESPNILETLGSKEYCTKPKYEAMGDARYFLTKLLNVMFVRAFEERIGKSTPLVINAVNPGFCLSNIRKTFSGMQVVVDFLMEKWVGLPTEAGSRQLLRGRYITLWYQVDEVSDYILSAEGREVQDRVWKEMVEILVKVDSRVESAVNSNLS
ncbi:hypothetical protein R3P38DRAFT_3307133 [Favolaschia claudopus]|uniref:NAD(P)-binding protein n=1 Tax=Favolaschia claudopus TaxID=2862362 RepID=A0AAW0DAI2_9AGAR